MEKEPFPEEDLPDTRDIRSPRSRSRHVAETRKESQRRRSVSQSSHRSTSPAADKLSQSRSSNNGTEEEPEGLGSRRPSKSSGPKLNTWDVPEFLPGALPRANPVQRAFFEERSKKVFNNNRIMDAIDAQESRERREAEDIALLESHMKTLRELFPTVEIEVLQETYFALDGNIDAAINQLLVISQGASGGTSSPTEGKAPPSSDDEREFPSLMGRSKKVLEKIISDVEMTIIESDPLEDGSSALNKYDSNSYLTKTRIMYSMTLNRERFVDVPYFFAILVTLITHSSSRSRTGRV